MHRAMSLARDKQQRRSKKKRLSALAPNFHVGDFVLRSRVDSKHKDKLLVMWVGPYQVVAADEYTFRVKHLVTGVESDVHSSRLKFYYDGSLNVTEEIREHVASQGIILAVEELLAHRWSANKKDYEILVRWKGLEPIEDSWESLTSLYKDIRILVDKYVFAQSDPELQRHCASLG